MNRALPPWRRFATAMPHRYPEPSRGSDLQSVRLMCDLPMVPSRTTQLPASPSNRPVGLSNRRFGPRNRRFGLRNRRFGPCNRRFGLRNRPFGLRNRRFGPRNRRFGLSNRRFGLRNRPVGPRTCSVGTRNRPVEARNRHLADPGPAPTGSNRLLSRLAVAQAPCKSKPLGERTPPARNHSLASQILDKGIGTQE